MSVWPRDSAFVAAALSAYGHAEDASRLLGFLQSVQREDGLFEARYLPDASGRAPDDRGVQLDGSGWSLWALLQWVQHQAEPRRSRELTRFGSMLERASAACLRLTDDGASLPPISPDYWEIKEDAVTLGNAAPFLIGLQAASKLYVVVGESQKSTLLEMASIKYHQVIQDAFSPNGYCRYTDSDERDAVINFLFPPLVTEIDPKVVPSWRSARRELRRPAGGLAPGAGWKNDGISWTPHTALFSLTAACIVPQSKQGMAWIGCSAIAPPLDLSRRRSLVTAVQRLWHRLLGHAPPCFSPAMRSETASSCPLM